MGKPSLTGSALLSAPTDWCAAEAAFMWAPICTWAALLRTHTAFQPWNRLKAACARCTIYVVPHHAFAVIWDTTASGTALAVARYGIRQLALLWLGTAADLSVLPSCLQLLPSLLQHPSTQCEVICNAAAGGAALANARYGSRLLTTPSNRTTAVKRELPSCPPLFTPSAAAPHHAKRSGL